MEPHIVTHQLDEQHQLLETRVPPELCTWEILDQLWAIKPTEFSTLKIFNREVQTPRWQRAYDRDYLFSSNVEKAEPHPEIIQPHWQWVRENISADLNGMLVNWYDGALGHYMGKHRDTEAELVPDSVVVTISLGETRTFRLRPYKGKGFIDFPAANGAVFVLPWSTNLAWTHEIPKELKCRGRRVSLTYRHFLAT